MIQIFLHFKCVILLLWMKMGVTPMNKSEKRTKLVEKIENQRVVILFDHSV